MNPIKCSLILSKCLKKNGRTKKSSRLHKYYVISVIGIRKITALHLTIYINFFTRYQNPNQLVCYCGVIPFEHSSGTRL
ncbi:transposase [Aquimarina aquimarini]|uniref:transposase n=1 Tax=Aquimarina aquimarini TaxID=1191734 RepID=UPI003CC58EA2